MKATDATPPHGAARTGRAADWMHWMMHANEARRWTDRQPCCQRIRFSWLTDGKPCEAEGVMIELAHGGLACLTRAPLAASGTVTIQLLDESSQPAIRGVIRHTQKMLPGLFRIGVECD